MSSVSRKSVSPHLEYAYEEFRRQPDPFGMADELAASRTLLIEFREAIEAQTEEKVKTFCKGVGSSVRESIRDIVGHALGVAPEDRGSDKRLDKLSGAVSASVAQDIFCLYEEIWGPVSRITPEQARVMAGLLKNVGDLAEKFKKMCERARLRVDYDGQVIDALTRFLAICVLPYCSLEQKAIIGDQALKFLPSASADILEAELAGA